MNKNNIIDILSKFTDEEIKIFIKYRLHTFDSEVKEIIDNYLQHRYINKINNDNQKISPVLHLKNKKHCLRCGSQKYIAVNKGFECLVCGKYNKNKKCLLCKIIDIIIPSI